MTARELIIKLQQFEPDTEVWLPATTRKGIPTYAAIDHIVPCDYGNLATDLTDTPDNIDTRLLGGRKDNDTVIVLSSMFDFRK
ncbi:hypothetical protein [Duncaniella muris]|jgi:hypothetical protein|uniref:hypothetical protein n=1 Tax=Duncaniella muris TaxID=2094150 RepID=UPI0010A45BFD|nr:hypothetical protein [Duncaniella muris]NBH93905.1 hypothetical protein [Muribaculaceae bacterium S4]NBI22214.1 hypothetical protein [Muribaculaceae bacterium Z1]QCD40173.1 hypothetical protein E7745_11935 [Duncaniella sp. C9]QCP71172.1 hypothetical protein FDZ78_00575 [Duncaniella sp. B8]GFI51931.1 hypothetical protein IMSAGC021_00222 [Muribaculaceae bacterium]